MSHQLCRVLSATGSGGYGASERLIALDVNRSSMDALDALGIAVLDYHRGNRQDPCMIERDDGVLMEEPVNLYFETEQDWRDEEIEALSAIHSRALDIGCGAGRHLLALQRRAFAVGLDNSRLVLRVCRERGARMLVLGCARRLPFKAGSFDAVLLMNNGLGISGDLKRTTEMLTDVGRVLSSRGQLIGHTSNPNEPGTAVDEGYRSRNLSARRPAGLVKLRVRYRSYLGPWFELMLLAPREVQDLLRKTGLRLKKTIPWESSRIYVANPE